MRQRPLGYLALVAIGLPLAAGALIAVLVRFVAFPPPQGVYLLTPASPIPDAVDRVYLWASPAFALTGLVLLCVAWWRRRWPFSAPARQPSNDENGPAEWVWLALAAGCGVALGFYSGALHSLEPGLALGGVTSSTHLTTTVTYFVLLPSAILALADARRWGRSLPRLFVMMAALQIAVHVSSSLTLHGPFRHAVNWTALNAAFFLGGCILLLALELSGALLRTERLRPAPPNAGPDSPPRRA